MEGCVRGVTIRRRRRRKRERTRTKEQRDKGTKGQRDKGTKKKKMGGKPSLTDIPCEFGLSPHFFSFFFFFDTLFESGKENHR
jgi:hypothetical protein